MSADIAALFSTLQHIFERNNRSSTSSTASDAVLSREKQLLTYLDNPHQSYPIVHIAGTKGKGSVAAMLAAMLQQGGYRVGLFTSPHLELFHERFQINGQMVSDQDLVRAAQGVIQHWQDIAGLRWFEAVTGIAFQYFANQAVDIAIVEAGVGGLGDATNIVTPILSILTSISHDHMYTLGNTLSEIAYQKAGIIKSHTPVIVAPQAPEVLQVIRASAQAKHAPLQILGQDVPYVLENPTLEGQTFSINGMTFTTALIGQHQGVNGALAVAAAMNLDKFPLNAMLMQRGLAQMTWPGRFETIRSNPVTVIDAAHNPHAMQVLSQTIIDLFPSRRKTIIFGASADKDACEMLQQWLGLADELILTQTASGRAIAPESLHEIALEIGFQSEQCFVTQTIEAAVHMAFNQHAANGLVCITGSVFVVGAARTFFKARISEP